jgi:hypothetical protein
MQLRDARVCLDCEEVHDAQQCPVCASETFAFLTRWVPVDEQRAARPVQRPPAEPPASAPPGRWVKRGVASLALLAAGQWVWRATRPGLNTDTSKQKSDDR